MMLVNDEIITNAKNNTYIYSDCSSYLIIYFNQIEQIRNKIPMLLGFSSMF